MAGFEPQTSDVRSDYLHNWATTTARYDKDVLDQANNMVTVKFRQISNIFIVFGNFLSIYSVLSKIYTTATCIFSTKTSFLTTATWIFSSTTCIFTAKAWYMTTCKLTKLNLTKVLGDDRTEVLSQCDQMSEHKVAQRFPKVAQKVATAVFT